MVRRGEEPRAIHNNCSGKHAGMLALARQLGADPQGYAGSIIRFSAPSPQVISEIVRYRSRRAAARHRRLLGADLGHSFAQPGAGLCPVRLGEGLSPASARRLHGASSRRCAAHPFMVAGTDRFCTKLMQAVPRAFVKTGAEGVFCGAIPHAGLGIALKCDDGAGRASETAMAAVMASLPVWTPEEKASARDLRAPISTTGGRSRSATCRRWCSHRVSSSPWQGLILPSSLDGRLEAARE